MRTYAERKFVRPGFAFVAILFFMITVAPQAEAWFFGSGSDKAKKTPFPLPKITMKSVMDESKVALEGLRGKVMLINFWATWCKPCVEEMPTLNRIYKELADQGFTIVGISMDSGSSRPAKTLAGKMGITYPVTRGSDKIARQFGEIIGIPVTFLVDREGTVVKRYDGPRDYEVFLKDIKDILLPESPS